MAVTDAVTRLAVARMAGPGEEGEKKVNAGPRRGAAESHQHEERLSENRQDSPPEAQDARDRDARAGVGRGGACRRPC